MPNIASVLKEEIRRLARKEARVQIAPLKKASVQHRREIASLKRLVKSQERSAARMEKSLAAGRTPGAQPVRGRAGPAIRFSARSVASHRKKLGISAADYASLVGISSLTVYNWEKGKTKPQAKQLVSLAAVLKLGKREVAGRLEGVKPARGRKRAKKG